MIGGGYAGALAANRLRMRDSLDITVVDPRAAFVDRVRLHHRDVEDPARGPQARFADVAERRHRPEQPAAAQKVT